MKSESRGRQGLAEVTPVVSSLAGLEPGLLTPNILPPSPHDHHHCHCHQKPTLPSSPFAPSPRLVALHASSRLLSAATGDRSVWSVVQQACFGTAASLPPGGAMAPAILTASALSRAHCSGHCALCSPLWPPWHFCRVQSRTPHQNCGHSRNVWI